MADKLITTSQLLQMLAKYNHKELHVHHTWKPNHSNFNGSNYQKVQDGMRRSHLGRGFVDIAQHVTLFPDGMFMTGRDFGQNPASISGYNRGAFCVEMVGDFDKGQDKFEGKQKEAMLSLARFFDLQGKYIRFHRENAPKTCPGTSIDKNQFMAEVRQYVKAAAVNKKEETEVGEVFSPSTPILKERAQTVLSRFNKKENGPLDKSWGEKLKKDELSDSDMIGLLYNAVFNGHIGNIELIAQLQKENQELKKRIDKLEGLE